MGLQLAVLPGVCTLGFGVLAGVAISISAIRAALQKYRSQMIWLILGLMLGSLYAIANGPESLATPRPALSMATFQPVGFVLGATVLLALEDAKMMMERKEQPGVPIVKGGKIGMNLDWIILHGLRVLTTCPLLDFWDAENYGAGQQRRRLGSGGHSAALHQKVPQVRRHAAGRAGGGVVAGQSGAEKSLRPAAPPAGWTRAYHC